jgi:cell division protease FtsH
MPAPGGYLQNGGARGYGSPQPLPSGQAGSFGQPNVEPYQGYRGPNGTPNPPNGTQQGGNPVPAAPAGYNPSSAGPPNYDAPPGWSPATTPNTHGQSTWKPSWESSGGGGQPPEGNDEDQNKKR